MMYNYSQLNKGVHQTMQEQMVAFKPIALRKYRPMSAFFRGGLLYEK
jgi:hypothetical protein